jgi:hypothetical protein
MNTPEASPASADWHIPSHVHPLIHDGGLITLNSRDGLWGELSRLEGAVLLKASGADQSVEADWPELEQKHFPPAILHALIDATLLAPGDYPNAPIVRAIPPEEVAELEVGNIVLANVVSDNIPPPQLLEVAHNAMTRTLGLIKSEPFGNLISELRDAQRPHPPATLEEAVEVAQTIHYVSQDRSDRIDCYQRVVATVLGGASVGRHISMQFGAAVDPNAFHVWPIAQGQQVRLPHEEPILGRYYPVFTV